MSNQQERSMAFKALHEAQEPFLIPNPWDVGSARLLSSLGFPALATTSLGVAMTQGRIHADASSVLSNCRDICESTDLPVNADLENGFATDPEGVAKCVTAAGDGGAVGASIEDADPSAQQPIYDFNEAVERVAAAVEAAHSHPIPIVLTARSENLLFGINDLDDTIRRLQAFEAVGADVLYAPGLRTLKEMETVVSSVTKPINVVMGFADPTITLDDLAGIGVRRVSIGGALLRLAMQSFLEGAREMKNGKFNFVRNIAPISDLHQAFAAGVKVDVPSP